MAEEVFIDKELTVLVKDALQESINERQKMHQVEGLDGSIVLGIVLTVTFDLLITPMERILSMSGDELCLKIENLAKNVHVDTEVTILATKIRVKSFPILPELLVSRRVFLMEMMRGRPILIRTRIDWISEEKTCL